MLDASISLLLLVTLTFFAAGFVKGVTGMGLPTVAMGVLGALVSPLAAATLLLVPSFVTNVWQLVAGPSFGPLLRRLWPMMLSIAVGTLLASSWLASGDIRATTAALGLALAVYSAYTLFARQRSVPMRMERWLSPFVGVITGAVTGGTGVFVIPAVPYLQSLGLGKDDLVQALGLSFTVSTVALAIGIGGRGAFESEYFVLSVLAIVPALLGMWAGQRVRDKISPPAFRRAFLIALMLLGLEMLSRTAL